MPRESGASSNHCVIRDCWVPRFRGGRHPRVANAPLPVFFGRPRGGRIPSLLPPALEKEPRARGTPRVPGALKLAQRAQTKVLGPAGPGASRHRGLPKSVVPQVRQNPRRPARGVYRLAPHRPRWTDLSGASPSGEDASPPLVAARPVGPGRCGLDRRAFTPHLQREVTPRPPLPAPHLKMLYRHPSVTRAGCAKR
jgi:hypothetical protein